MPEVSEEDEIQKAIALSLEGGAGLGVRGASSGGVETGWGGRLAEQERAEEQRYKEEAEKAVREEVSLSRIKLVNQLLWALDQTCYLPMFLRRSS